MNHLHHQVHPPPKRKGKRRENLLRIEIVNREEEREIYIHESEEEEGMMVEDR
jgi:hypothetical protein